MEGDEEFDIELENPTGGAAIGLDFYTYILIADDEAGSTRRDGVGEVQFEKLFYGVNEADGNATITVSRTNYTVGTISVFYSTSPALITPAISSIDYKSTSGTLIFEDGVSSQTFSVQIYNDDILEGTEAIQLDLNNPIGSVDLGTRSATLIISDSDNASGSAGETTISFEKTINKASENDGTLTYALIRTGDTTGVVSVEVIFENGSAIFGEDFTASSQSFTVTFQDGETRVTKTISIVDDSIAENEENHTLRLSNPQGGAIISNTNSASIIITDNDSVPPSNNNSDDETGSSGTSTISFEKTINKANENDSTITIVLNRTGNTNGAVSIDVTFEDGSAQFGEDFTASGQSFTVTFQDGETQATETISIIDDSISELEEGHILRLSNPQGGAIIGTLDSTFIIITDNDGGALSNAGSDSSEDKKSGSFNPLFLLVLLMTPLIIRQNISRNL